MVDSVRIDLREVEDISVPMVKLVWLDNSLRGLPLCEVPDEYVYLRAIADYLCNLAIPRGAPRWNLKGALQAIKHVREDLDIAEKNLEKALSQLGGVK